jgi:hypothetical protein
MSLQIDSDEATETVKDTIADAVRGALGPRLEGGQWRLLLRRLPQSRGILVDLNNSDGISRQWVFGDASDPIAQVIKREL